MIDIPSCAPKFMNTRKLKSQQESNAQTGTLRFVTFLNILGAFFRTDSPYRVREAMYKAVFASETMKTSIEALMTWSKPRIRSTLATG